MDNASELKIENLSFERWRSSPIEDLKDYLLNVSDRLAFYQKNQEEDQLVIYNKHKLVLMIFASNAYEGSKISKFETYKILSKWMEKNFQDSETETEIKEVLERESNQPNKRQDPASKREVLQHFLAYNYLMSKLEEPLTVETIKETHRVLMELLLDDEGDSVDEGKFRTVHISAKQFLFVDPKYIDDRMKELVNMFNKLVLDNGVDSCLLAGYLMAEFLTIHPFNDGNGRVSRLLFHFALAKRGIRQIMPLVEDKENKNLYIDALKRYQRHTKIEERLSTLWLFSAKSLSDSLSNFYNSYSKFGK